MSLAHAKDIASEAVASDVGLSERDFKNPPASARPHTWWHWMNGNVTKEGITADLEAMAAVGIGGVQIFDAGLALPKGPVEFATDAWYDCLDHANREAKRLGLELCIANCSGWTSSAGPWITPELSMKFVTNTTVRVKGGEKFEGVLPLPNETNGFYEDIAVIAFPSPSAQAKWTDFDWQVFRRRGAEHAPVMPAKLTDALLPRESCVAKDEIIDLAKDGRAAIQRDATKDSARPALHLSWKAPDSHAEWTVLRIGYMCNGRTNRSASQAGLGLECDKLDAHALDVHFDAYVGEALKRLGGPSRNSLGGGGFNNVLLDSYEVHGQNWTRSFEKTFSSRMGYLVFDYLPVLAGYPVDSAAETEKFLKDFRLTLSEEFVKNYAQQLQKRCNENRLLFSCEPYGNGPFNDLEYARYCDIPMSEFWQPYTNGTDLAAMARDPNRKFMEARWGNRGLGNGKAVAATAHVWGKRIVGAEACTAYPTKDAGRWLQGPFELKAQIDRVFSDGVNRLIFHRYAHQPWTNPTRYPGMTMAAYGGHFDRTQTWWKHGAKEFFECLARTQLLLQQGVFVADVLLCTSGEAPDYGTSGVIPTGYDGDRCHPNAIAKSKVVNGFVVVPGGVRYRVVGTPPRNTLRPGVVAALKRLEKAGATVVEYGEVESSLKRLGCKPDFICDDQDATWLHRNINGDDAYFVAVPGTKSKNVKCSFRISGRTPELWNPVTGEIATANNARTTNDGRTEITLNCDPAHSVFVVFRTSKQGSLPTITGSLPTEMGSLPKAIPVVGTWDVTFCEPISTNEIVTAKYTKLESWTNSENPDIRYFSGTASYFIKFSIPLERVPPQENTKENGVSPHENGVSPQENGVSPQRDRVLLDLGEVKNIAEVTVNGKAYPALWKPPFRLDITEALGGTQNSTSNISLEVKVTNYWPNRLIGDALLPDDCEWDDGSRSKGYPLVKAYPDWLVNGLRSPTGRHAFSTCRLWTDKQTPLTSGLLGPVSILFQR